MGRLARWLAALVLVLVAVPALAAPTFPKLTGRVVDEARLLSPAQASEIENKLAALEERSGRQLVVATVTDLQGYDIQDYGYQLGRHWQIGDEKRDDGVILLVAPKERKVGIETGYGAGVYVTDAMASRIITGSILPKFKSGDMGGGIVAGTDELVTLMELPPEEAARRNREVAAGAAKAKGVEIDGGVIVAFIVIFFFFILPLLRAASRGRRYRGKKRRDGGIDPMVILWGLEALDRASRGRRGGGWGGGGGFGGFGGGGGGGFGGFSGGGGSFGGGGASGSW